MSRGAAAGDESAAAGDESLVGGAGVMGALATPLSSLSLREDITGR